MDDFTRGALEMQRVAAAAIDTKIAQIDAQLVTLSKGMDHAYLWNRLHENRDRYVECAKLIRSIKIQDAVK